MLMFHLRICIPWDHHHQLLHNISQPMICLWETNTDLIFFLRPRFIKKNLPIQFFFFPTQISSISVNIALFQSCMCVCVALILSFSMWWWCLSHRCINSCDFFLSLYSSVISFWSSLLSFVYPMHFFDVRSFILRTFFFLFLSFFCQI